MIHIVTVVIGQTADIALVEEAGRVATVKTEVVER
jgi:hypothetical protein